MICQDISVFTKGKGSAWGWYDKATCRKAKPEAIFSIMENLEMAEKNNYINNFVMPPEMENILPFKPRKLRYKQFKRVSKVWLS